MRSLIYQGLVPRATAPCAIGRQEATTTLRKDGQSHAVVVRDKLAPEDPYMVLVKAAGFARRKGVPFPARVPGRGLKDTLIKGNVTI